jgi:branched-chain amino acid aminotransferase
MRWVYLNDRFVPEKDAVVSVFDHGFLYGDGVYETMRAYRGRVLLLAKHLARLERSASRLQLALPVSLERMAELLRTSLERNQLQDPYIRITVSRGPGEIGLDPSLCKTPTLVIIARPFRPYPDSFYSDGVDIAIVRTRRNLPEALPPEVKSLNFLNNILAKIEATATGAYDGVLLNHRDELTEATTSNLFLVQNGRLRTPALECGILDGITRGIVLKLAQDLALPTEESRLGIADLAGADECFLTNTTLEVLPVKNVNGRPVGSGRPGPLTGRLHQSFRAGLDGLLDDM